jgi:hypothetical protein
VDLAWKNAESRNAIALYCAQACARERALRASAACKGRELAQKACFIEPRSGHSKQTQQHQNGLFRLLLQTVDSDGALKQGPTSRGDEPSAQAIGSSSRGGRRGSAARGSARFAAELLIRMTSRFARTRALVSVFARALRERHPDVPRNLF